MDSFNKKDLLQQKIGGGAALYMAFAYLLAMPYFLIVVDYLGAITAKDKVELIINNFNSMYSMYLITYVFFGIVLGILAFSLYDRLKIDSSPLIRIATFIGLLWSFSLTISGMIYNYGMITTINLSKIDLLQAQENWQSIEPIAMGLGGAGGELLGGLWVFLISLIAHKSKGLPKLLNWLGFLIGISGVLSTIPFLHDVGMIFGILQIFWLIWLGIVLLKSK